MLSKRRWMPLLLMAVVLIGGCGHNENENQVEMPPEIIDIEPSVGSEIEAKDTITLTFDKPPTDVTATPGIVLPTGNTVMLSGPFIPGGLDITVRWKGGIEKLNFTVLV